MIKPTNLPGDKNLTVSDLERLEKVLGLRLPDNCAIEIRELSAEELDCAVGGRPLAASPRFEGTVGKLHFHRAGDDLFKLRMDFVGDNQV